MSDNKAFIWWLALMGTFVLLGLGGERLFNYLELKEKTRQLELHENP